MAVGNKLRFLFFILAVGIQIFILTDINKHSISFHETCSIEMTTLNKFSLLFCKTYLRYVNHFSSPLIKALEITPESTFEGIRKNRKKIMKKLHTDNPKTGDQELFIKAEDFYTISKFNFKFQIQKRNILIFGRTVEDKSQSRMNKDLYNLTREMGWRISWAVMIFVVSNILFLFIRYQLWAKIVYFFFSFVFMIVPVSLSFVLKFTLIEMTKSSDFVSEFYLKFLEYFGMSWSVFPGYSVQDLELAFLHLSCFWTLLLMLTFPLSKKGDMHKELNSLYRDIKRKEKNPKLEIPELNLRVSEFYKKYLKKGTKWDKIKGYIKSSFSLVFGIGLPLFLHYYYGAKSS